jgi:farnesyl diphosphate synthase
MREAVLGGGKRVRPLVALRVGELLGLRQEQLRGLCNCVELLHSASFVLDDLPSMDGAYERRGKPPLHLLYDEATAILAANALLVLAFEELVTRSPGVPQKVVMDLTVDAARTVGVAGMTGGQHEDLTRFEGRRASHRVFEAVQRKKTGVLFEFAARAAARMAGATPSQTAAIDRYAVNLGIAFQMNDDILAATKSPRELGKGSRHDTGRALLQHNAAQLAWARRTADRHMVKADAALAIFGPGAQALRELSRMILSRG